MLDIGSNKRQEGSGGLSSRPSQISSQIRHDEGTVRREQNRSSSQAAARREEYAHNNRRGLQSQSSSSQNQSATARREEYAHRNRRGLQTSSQGQRYGSAKAAEEWSNAANSRGTYNIQSGDTLSAIAKRELGSSSRWREIKKADGSAFTESEAGRLQIGQRVHLSGASGSSNNRAGQPSNLRGMSANAAERWSNAAKNRGSYTVNSGDTLSAIAKRELGSSSRWREIKKADGSAFTESEAGRLQIGQRVHLSGTSGSSNNRAGQPSNLRGTSADAAERWSNVVKNRGDQTARHSSVSQISSGVGNTARGVDFGLRQRYQLEPQRGGTVTGIRDTHAGKVRGNPPKPVGSPLIRFDVPDKKTKHPHININPALTGKPDPHTRISPTTLRVAGGTARTLETVGRVARPVAIVTDGIRLADAVRADGGLGRNTAVTAGSVAGGWGGAATGAWAGAQGGALLGGTIGSIIPGAGTAVGAGVGGFVGGIAGGIGGAFGGSELGENAVEWFWK